MPNTSQTTHDEEEDDEDSWEPLHSEDFPLTNETSASERESHVSSSALNPVGDEQSVAPLHQPQLQPPTKERESENRNSRTESAETFGDPPTQSATTKKLARIRQRLDTKLRLQESLIDHPIRLFWSRFFIYFVRELWSLDISITVALCLLSTGLFLKVMLLCTWSLWFPRFLFIGIMLVVPWFFLDPKLGENILEGLGQLATSPEQLVKVMSQGLNGSQLRFVGLTVLFLPVWLEVRTLSFLTTVHLEASWTFYNLLITWTLVAVTAYLFRIRAASPLQSKYCSFVLLYLSALFVTFLRFDLSRLPFLAAPFLSATGVLLLQAAPADWPSRVLRRAGQFAIRDVLACMQDSFREDELLQIAMLRWIVDYWANSSSNSTAQAFSGPTRPVPSTSPSPNAPASANSSGVVQRRGQSELEWKDLWSMLNQTTQTMSTEIRFLQEESSGRDSSSFASPKEDSTRAETPRQQTGAAEAAPSAQMQGLGDMLTSMDLDEHAKPAVMAYKRAVQELPPDHIFALAVGMARRCPALLLLVWWAGFGYSVLSSATLLLLPLIGFELLRIQRWSRSCQESLNEDQSFLQDMDSMTVLLSDDDFDLETPPTLLRVWQNVLESVTALEQGLTAARCVQSTAAAVDLGQNVLSLLELGWHISQAGWLPTLCIVVSDVCSFAASRPDEARYTQAAMRALANSRTLHRHWQALEGEAAAQTVVAGVVGFLAILVGQGWLWGRVDEDLPRRHPMRTSTVEIYEIADDEMIVDEVVADEALVDEVVDKVIEQSVDIPCSSECAHQETGAPDESGTPGSRSGDQITVAMEEQPQRTPEKGSDEAEGQGSNDTFRSDIGADERRVELAQVMDKVASCHELGLLDEDEMGRLLERFAAVDESDVEWVKATNRSLQALLVSERNDELPEDQELKWDEQMTTSKLQLLLDDDDDFEALEQPSVLGNDDDDRPREYTEHGMVNQEEDDNLWIKVGGGLAIVGAIVGSIAVANSQGGRRRHP